MATQGNGTGVATLLARHTVKGRFAMARPVMPYLTAATRSALVVPGTPNGIPAITTISSPRVQNPS